MMNIQIFGTKKCFDTKKAERYFKERRIKYQFIDLNIKGLSKRELQGVRVAVGIAKLIDSTKKEYKTLNLDKIRTMEMKEEILLNNPKVYKTPIVRNGNKATVGYDPETWNSWE